MAPYVYFQERIIDWLFRIQSTEERFLRELLQAFRNPEFEFSLILKAWEKPIQDRGFIIPFNEEWDMVRGFHDIILEQIDDSGVELKIRNLLGTPLYPQNPVGLKEWTQKRGNGGCRLRTKRFAQPGALKIGDILITGEKIIDEPRDGGNGEVLIHLSGRKDGVWLGVPAQTALALLTSEDDAPVGLVER